MPYLYCGSWSFQTPPCGIAAFALKDSRWEPLGTFGTDVPAQSILAFAGKDLLSVSERRDGGNVVRYRIREDGTPEPVGLYTCDTPLLSYVTASPDGQYAFVTSMGSNRLKMLRLEEDGSLRLTDEKQFTGHSILNRQESAKTHSSRVSPDGTLLAVANLGADEVELFRIDRETETLTLTQSVPVDFGRQPRHMAFRPDGRFLYLLTEAGNRVYVFRVRDGRLAELAAYNTPDPDFAPGGYAADIGIREDGQFLYASNRGQSNVAVWRVLPDGLLDLAGHYDCGGKGPRGLVLSPDGGTLFCANNESGNVTVLSVDPATGVPEGVRQVLDVPFAACVRYLP